MIVGLEFQAKPPPAAGEWAVVGLRLQVDVLLEVGLPGVALLPGE